MKKKLLITGSIIVFIIIVVTILIVFMLSGSKIARKDYELKSNKWNNWEDVFDNPQDITVEVFNTGKMKVPIDGTLNLKHENAKDVEKKDIILEIPVFLVNHKKYGFYLIDAGLDSSYQDNPYGTLKGLLVKIMITKAEQEKNGYIAAVLKDRKINLNGVFFTHLHFDHIAGVLDLPKDIKYIAGKGEEYMNMHFLFKGDHLKGVKVIEEIEYNKGIKMPPFDQCIDIFGDGSLIAVHTQGHAKGHTSYLVNGADRKVFITGDACFYKFSLERGVGPGFYSADIEEAQETLEKIKIFSEKYPDIKMHFGHEL